MNQKFWIWVKIEAEDSFLCVARTSVQQQLERQRPKETVGIDDEQKKIIAHVTLEPCSQSKAQSRSHLLTSTILYLLDITLQIICMLLAKISILLLVSWYLHTLRSAWINIIACISLWNKLLIANTAVIYKSSFILWYIQCATELFYCIYK